MRSAREPGVLLGSASWAVVGVSVPLENLPGDAKISAVNRRWLLRLSRFKVRAAPFFGAFGGGLLSFWPFFELSCAALPWSLVRVTRSDLDLLDQLAAPPLLLGHSAYGPHLDDELLWVLSRIHSDNVLPGAVVDPEPDPTDPSWSESSRPDHPSLKVSPWFRKHTPAEFYQCSMELSSCQSFNWHSPISANREIVQQPRCVGNDPVVHWMAVSYRFSNPTLKTNLN